MGDESPDDLREVGREGGDLERARDVPAQAGFHPSGGSHGTVPMSAGTEISRISSASDVRISLCRMPPGMYRDSPAWRRRVCPSSNSRSTHPLRA